MARTQEISTISTLDALPSAHFFYSDNFLLCYVILHIIFSFPYGLSYFQWKFRDLILLNIILHIHARMCFLKYNYDHLPN